MKLQWNQPKKFSNPWNTKEEQGEERRKEKREKGNEIRNPYKGSKTPKSRACFLLLPWSLYIGIGHGFSVAKISQISFKIKININI